MLKKSITFNDLDGNPVTEDFYFSLNKAELTEMEMSTDGGLGAYMEKITKTQDRKELIKIFKELILKSVGRRGDDNRKFIKNQDIIDDFTQTEAYSELFMELATQEGSAVEFMKGIIPGDLEDYLKKIGQPKDGAPALPEAPQGPVEPSWLREGRTPTPEEVRNATPEQLQMAFSRKQADQAQTPPA